MKQKQTLQTQNKEEYKKTELGELPESWEVVTINDLFDIQQGKQLSSKESKEGKIEKPFLRTSNIFWEGIDVTNVSKMFFTQEEFEKLKLRAGDILVCEGGDIGRTALYSGELEECAYQNHLHRLRAKNEKDSKQFFVYWMNYAINQRKMYIQDANRTTIPNLSSSRLKNFRIPRPPLDEQQKIAYVLSTIQNAKEKTENTINALKELKKSMMKHLFTYGPVSLEETKNVKLKETEIGEIPEGWNISKLAQVALITMGQSPPGNTYNEENKGMPFLQGKAEFGPIHPTHIKYTSKPLKIAKKDSILLSVRAPVGDVNIANIDYCIGRGLASISSIAGNNLFLFYLLMFLKQNIEKEGTGSTFKAINKNKLQNLIILDLPTEIQEKIASVLWTIDEKIEIEETKKRSLDQLFKSMLHNLMTAKIRVNTLNIKSDFNDAWKNLCKL